MSELTLLSLNDLHEDLGARMVPFAGYSMPVQYSDGVMHEHLHTRAKSGLFDVSHMGQVILRPHGTMEDTALAFESLMPVDVLGLAIGRQRYGIFTNETGGILDDLMFANRGDHYLVVVNADCKDSDIAHMQKHLAHACDVTPVIDRALLALQGPMAEAALISIAPDVADMRFMDVISTVTNFGELWVSRSGYTGEDGFEISVLQSEANEFSRRLLADKNVAPVGLGARDSLRLEAGLCLYGHDITAQTSPVEAGLTWAISKSRRTDGARMGGFPGANTILTQMRDGPARKLVGLRPQTRAPMREGTKLFIGDPETVSEIGVVTSGGFGPTVESPIAMGYVDARNAAVGTELTGEVRGKLLPVTVTKAPFITPRYKR